METLDSEDLILELVQQEVNILRHLLSNLSLEQQALMNKDDALLDQINGERRTFLIAFEEIDIKLLDAIVTLADAIHKNIPSLESLSRSDMLDALQDIVSEDNLELRSRLDQLRALVEEVYNKNSITHYFLQTTRGSPSMQPEPISPEKHKKVQLEVLDPEKESV